MTSKRESHVNTQMGTDHHQRIIPPISKDCSNILLERSNNMEADCNNNVCIVCIGIT